MEEDTSRERDQVHEKIPKFELSNWFFFSFEFKNRDSNSTSYNAVKYVTILVMSTIAWIKDFLNRK